VTSGKEGQTICSGIREVIYLCKQEAVDESLIVPICHADERTAKYCGISVKAVTSEGRASTEMKEALCTPQERRAFEHLK
jgi:hypothetical protein